MASIATGIAYHSADAAHPQGRITSTGAKMRSFTTDQSGGTDSGDAVQSWHNGYAQTLTVRDGYTFDNALQDLTKGSLVHLDVWHGTVGGPCLSGSGGYGHTMAVAPDCKGGSWLVADPWCSPPRWARVTESKLRAGAEEWGRRVLGAATGGSDWTGPKDWPDPADLDDPRWAILRRVARLLMERYHAGGLDDPSPDPGDTGGGQKILFTRTQAIPLAGGGGSDVANAVIDSRPQLGDVAAGVDFFEAPGGARIGEMSKAFVGIEVVGVPMDASADHLNLGWRAIWLDTQAVNGVTSRKIVYVSTADLTNLRAIPTPTPPPSTDCDDAIAARDAEWEAWELKGAPSRS
jgi:hypothetical protein